MCSKSVVLLVTFLLVRIEASNRPNSRAFPQHYESFSLLASDTRNCTFDVLAPPGRVDPRSISSERKVVCIRSTLGCSQSAEAPFHLFCADLFDKIQLNLTAVKLPGVMEQLNAEAPINGSLLQICQQWMAPQYCQIDVTRSDIPLQVLIRVKFDARAKVVLDDCRNFRRLLRSELDVCELSAKGKERNDGMRVFPGMMGWIFLLFGAISTLRKLPSKMVGMM